MIDMSQDDLDNLQRVAERYLTGVDLEDFLIFLNADEYELAVDLLADFSVENEVVLDGEARTFVTQFSDRAVFIAEE